MVVCARARVDSTDPGRSRSGCDGLPLPFEGELSRSERTSLGYIYSRQNRRGDRKGLRVSRRGRQNTCRIGPYGAKYLVIDFGEGGDRYMPAGFLLEVVVRFRRDFFRRTAQN